MTALPAHRQSFRTSSAWIRVSVLVVLSAAACRKDDRRDPCIQPRTVYMRVGAYTLRDTTYVDSLLPSAVFIPVGANGALVSTAPSSRFALPLSPNADSSAYIVIADTAALGVRDTVVFRYRHTLIFLSNACGYTYFYTLTGVSHSRNALDSVAVLDPAVTNDADPEHIRLYY